MIHYMELLFTQLNIRLHDVVVSACSQYILQASLKKLICDTFLQHWRNGWNGKLVPALLQVLTLQLLRKA